jgi:hypothetical protein
MTALLYSSKPCKSRKNAITGPLIEGFSTMVGTDKSGMESEA